MNQDSVRGHLDSLILAIIAGGPMHGYAVIEALRVRTEGSLELPTGTVYPALRRLERAGLLAGSWSTVGGRNRRTYTLTSAGRRSLADHRTEWQRFTATIGAVLEPVIPNRGVDA